MIPAQALHRIVANIVDHVSADDLGGDDRRPNTSDPAVLHRLHLFAEDLELDVQDVATLHRVAAGEGPEPSPLWTLDENNEPRQFHIVTAAGDHVRTITEEPTT